MPKAAHYSNPGTQEPQPGQESGTARTRKRHSQDKKAAQPERVAAHPGRVAAQPGREAAQPGQEAAQPGHGCGTSCPTSPKGGQPILSPPLPHPSPLVDSRLPSPHLP